MKAGGGVSPAEARTGARLHVEMEWDTDPMAVVDLQSRTMQDALAARNWISEQRDKYELNMDRTFWSRWRPSDEEAGEAYGDATTSKT